MSEEKTRECRCHEADGESTGQAVVCRFIGVSRMHRKAIGKYSADIGLHHSQHRMLMHLANNEVIRSQKQLAEHFAISPAAVATMLKKLEADGYIERAKSQDGSDCRNNEIIITELGRRIATETEKYFRFVDSQAVKDFTDEEIEQFMRLLDKMKNKAYKIFSVISLLIPAFYCIANLLMILLLKMSISENDIALGIVGSVFSLDVFTWHIYGAFAIATLIIKYLKDKKIKIVTHSHLLIEQFSDMEAELFVIGGKYIPKYSMSVGPITLSDLECFNFDVSFYSCAGIDINRKLVYTAEIDTMAVKQKAMSLSVKNYLLIDSSKVSVKGFCSFIKSDDFDAVICNNDPMFNEEELPHNYILLD